MQTLDEKTSDPARKVPWNKGKLLGSKPPLQTKQVWAIRTKLQVEHRLRDLAMFNLAIDSKLRGCDLVSLKVEDVAPHGFALERARDGGSEALGAHPRAGVDYRQRQRTEVSRAGMVSRRLERWGGKLLDSRTAG